MLSPDRQQLLYRKCVQHVVDYVGARLGDEHRLEHLAGIAGFSPFHFHRVFKSVSGENLFECIRRLRLEWTASALVAERHRTIVDIALEAGFSSQPVFARMFRAHFGMSASQWQDGGFWRYDGRHWDWRRQEAERRLRSSRATRIAGAAGMYYLDHDMADAADGKQPACLHRFGVEELPPLRAMCLSLYGGMTFEQRNALWRRFGRWVAERGLTPSDHMAVLCMHGNPTIVARERLRHDIGLVIGADAVALPESDLQHISGGLCLVADFDSGDRGSDLAWEYLYQHWMPANGWIPDIRRPVHVRARFTNSAGDVRVQSCVPVKALPQR